VLYAYQGTLRESEIRHRKHSSQQLISLEIVETEIRNRMGPIDKP
jgi:hypothetical protein